MDPLSIFALVTKGLSIVETVWENRDLAYKAISSIKNLVSTPDPTPQELAETEAELDSLLAEFNSPLPPD